MTAKPFRPMLARAVAPDEQLRYPLLASVKLDGVRCLVIGGVPTSRSLKPLPNRNLAGFLPWHDLAGLDGELIVGLPNAPDAYNRTVSAVMSDDKPLDGMAFYVFDDFSEPDESSFIRACHVKMRCEGTFGANLHTLKVLTQDECRNRADVDLLEQRAVMLGYEGLMLRDPMAPYKFGRTASKGSELLKLKRFQDSEATILAAHPLMRNGNAAQVNELGLTDRATCKANMVPDALLGALDVRDCTTGVEFSIGSGFDQATRVRLWQERDTLPGRMVKYKFQPAGVKELPRFPVFLGFRSILDT